MQIKIIFHYGKNWKIPQVPSYELINLSSRPNDHMKTSQKSPKRDLIAGRLAGLDQLLRGVDGLLVGGPKKVGPFWNAHHSSSPCNQLGCLQLFSNSAQNLTCSSKSYLALKGCLQGWLTWGCMWRRTWSPCPWRPSWSGQCSQPSPYLFGKVIQTGFVVEKKKKNF